MTVTKNDRHTSTQPWVRIPNGTKVRHRSEAYEGVIDGLTEIVSGPDRNPDGKTQYRVNVGDSTRLLVSEHHLNILLDNKNLVLVGREPELYRLAVTNRLRAVFPEDRFVTAALKGPSSLNKSR
ncbi:MAG: hypothetical protein HP497_04980 [Nitrospira sp.]|nr:hypothetical protein [Nitrospira sp.]MBH0198763.1 hypothetical protein [Nitrospira sp.]